MKKQLEEELVMMLMPYLKDMNTQDLQMRIDMVLAKYDVTKAENALTVYEGDLNELMIRRFLSAKIAAGLSPRTIGYYKCTVTKVLQKIGKPYMDVTADDIRLYIAEVIHRTGVTKTTANNERRCLSSFYGWLQREEIMLKNPMSKVDPVKETKKKKKAFTQMELEQIRLACRTKRESALIEVMISTWARVSEVAQIRIDEIKGNSIIVHGKGDKDREVYLNAKAQLAISNYLAERKDNNPYLFPGGRWREWFSGGVKCSPQYRELWYTIPEFVTPDRHSDSGALESIVRKLGKLAGVADAHPHRFRRTGATMALRSGMPIVQVSKLLGHVSIATTQIYLDISDEELREAHGRYVT